MERTCTVVLLREEVGVYSVVVPALSGCFTQGESVPDALANAREEIQCYLGSLEQHGEPIPDDVAVVEFEWNGATEALVFRRVPLATQASCER